MDRALALLITCVYVCFGLVLDGWSGALIISTAIALPLACIFWSETMADACQGLRVVPLPPEVVFGLGWFVLLLPAILASILWLVL